MSKNTKSIAVVVVDMQDFFLGNVNFSVKKELFENQRKVLSLCNKNKIPVIFLEYGDGGVSRGYTNSVLKRSIDKSLATVIVKDSNSGFTNPYLGKLLNDLSIKRIILMGINANGCVQDTAIGAVKRNYKVITAKGIIANSYSTEIKLSNKNRRWYENNTNYLKSVDDLVQEFD